MQKKNPSAITSITLDRATFSKVPVNELTLINFFYGSNGTGKSTIAHVIEENDGVVWADGSSADDYDVLVYDQNYINRSLANYGELPGVFIFGEEDSEAKKRIEQLTDEKRIMSEKRTALLEKYNMKIAEIDTALIDFQNVCFSKTADIRKRFEKAMVGKKQKKSFAEAVLGEASPAGYDLSVTERLYDAAFDDNAKAYPEFEKVGTAPTYGKLPGKDILDKMIVSSSDTPFAKFMKALGSTASDWVRTGHTHYSAAAEGRCPYCQQQLPPRFEEDIAMCFDAQYQQDIRDLRQFCDVYERETSETVRVLRSNMSDVMTSIDIKPYQDKLALLESSFEINRQRIAEKIKEPTKTVSLEDTDSLLLEIGTMIDDINRSIKLNNNVVAEKRSSKQKCKIEIMQHLAFMLADDVEKYHDETDRLKKELEDITVHGRQLRRDINALSAEISELNKRNVNTAAAIESINRMLKGSGFQGFSLRAKRNSANAYEVIREDGSAAEDLSEGERNFIAFLYFCHQVRGSMNGSELKEKIVVIDDPVSGMDNTALFLVSAMVREMIGVCLSSKSADTKVSGSYIKQMFILTHNVNFHREITYKQVGCYDHASFYMIRKNDNISTIKLCKRQSPEMPSEEENYDPVRSSYAALWDELREIRSTIPALNVMRRILEYYFLQLCGYEGSELREMVLKEKREKFITANEGQQPDMTNYQLALSLLAFISAPNDIGSADYVESHDDVEAYKRVFEMIFEASGHSRHYRKMTGRA